MEHENHKIYIFQLIKEHTSEKVKKKNNIMPRIKWTVNCGLNHGVKN